MASSSIGSDVFVLLAFLVIALSVILLLRHFLPLRSTPAYLTLPVFLALALPCSVVLLVPIDLGSITWKKENDDIWRDPIVRNILLRTSMVLGWRVLYWLTFALTWFILPLLGEYMDSGDRTVRGRALYSLRSNGKYQLITLVSAVVAGIYIFLQNGFSGQSVKGLVMALAYLWGLILAICLMGHGLVALPRRLIRNASTAGRLRGLQAHAPKVNERLEKAMENLEQLEAQVLALEQRKTGISKDMQDWISELADAAALPESRLGPSISRQDRRTVIPSVITERYLADLARNLKRARHSKVRFVDEWDHLVAEAQDLQSILDAAASHKLDFGRSTSGRRTYTLLTPYTRYLFHARIIPALRLGLGGLLAGASACIIWSEITSPFSRSLSIINHTVAPGGHVNFGTQLIAGAWLTYMCLSALYTVSTAKVWGNRALVRRNTYPESATWYALQVAKLTVPLAFNFITLIADEVHQKTFFYLFLGRLVDLTPLGHGFSKYYPIFILVPAFAALGNLYGRIPSFLAGWSSLEDDDDDENNPSAFSTGGWREGRALIARDLEARGAGNGNVGLEPRASLDERPRASSPARAARSEQAQGLLAPRQREAATRPYADEEGEGEGEGGSASFFDDFAQRVRNTIDTAERPAFLDRIKRPKWMGGDDGEHSTTGSNEERNGLSKWFGGTGRLRL